MVALTLDDSDPVVILHAGGALVIDFSLGTRFLVKLSGNVTGISVIGHVAKNVRQVMFLQDSTGGRTVTWLAPGFRYPRGNPTINTAIQGRTVVNIALLPSFPTVFTVIDVPKPDRFWYAVELAVLLASGPLIVSDAAKANLILDNVPNATFLAKGDTAGLAPKASPTFTGAPAAPTATLGTNTTQLSTTAFVQAAVSALVNGAGPAVDTLKEIADLLAADESTAAALATTVASKADAAATTAALALKAPIADPDFTGSLDLTGGAGADVYARVMGDAGKVRGYRLLTGTLMRWAFGTGSTAESGSNAGSNLSLSAWDDAGAFIANVLSVVRATQVLTFNKTPTSAENINSGAVSPVATLIEGSLSTTSATVGELIIRNAEASKVTIVEGHVAAHRSGGAGGSAGDSAAYHVRFAVKNEAGTAALIGAGAVTVIGENNAAWDCTIGVTGGAWRLLVTGAASNNIDWKASLRASTVG